MDYSIEMDLSKKSRGGRQVLRESRTGVACLSGRLSFTSCVPKGSVLSCLGSTPLHGVGYVGTSMSWPPYWVSATWRILFARAESRLKFRAFATMPWEHPKTLVSSAWDPRDMIILSFFAILFGYVLKNTYIWGVKYCFNGAKIRFYKIRAKFCGGILHKLNIF